MTNIELIAQEFKTHSGYYMARLMKCGVPPHELDDALGTLFELAVASADTFKPECSHIRTWIGHSIARTVASRMHGSCKRSWRKAAALECAFNERSESVDDMDEQDFCAGVSDDDVDGNARVSKFMKTLPTVLTEVENAVLEAAGIEILHKGQLDGETRAHVQEELGMTDHVFRKTVMAIRKKLTDLAVSHFGAEQVAGREFVAA